MEPNTVPPIAATLWWVIPDRLAGVRKPDASELGELQALGVGAIVSVLDDPSNLDLYQHATIPHLWLPIKGGAAPSLEQIQELRAFVDRENQRGHAVAVHCTNGKRRTGTMLTAYLIAIGSVYEEAAQIVRHANPALDLREAQAAFLRALATQ